MYCCLASVFVMAHQITL